VLFIATPIFWGEPLFLLGLVYQWEPYLIILRLVIHQKKGS